MARVAAIAYRLQSEDGDKGEGVSSVAQGLGGRLFSGPQLPLPVVEIFLFLPPPAAAVPELSVQPADSDSFSCIGIS